MAPMILSLIVNNQGKKADLVEVQRAFLDVCFTVSFKQLLATTGVRMKTAVCMLFLDPSLV